MPVLPNTPNNRDTGGAVLSTFSQHSNLPNPANNRDTGGSTLSTVSQHGPVPNTPNNLNTGGSVLSTFSFHLPLPNDVNNRNTGGGILSTFSQHSKLPNPVNNRDTGGSVLSTTSQHVNLVSGCSSPAQYLDVRMYGTDGKRMLLPSIWIESLEFEITERGGYGQGTLKVKEEWAGLFATSEVERIDVRLWCQLVYRGNVRISHSDLSGEGQSFSPTLYGLIEVLNGYIVRRKYSFAAPVSPDQLFTTLVYDHVKRAGRQPGILVDTTGVAGLSLVVQQFDATGKSFSQAMNDLCDLFPQKVIWGIDTDASGVDRIYLRPRVTTTNYKFALGDNVRALTYPRDATQVVNSLLVTGATLDGSGYPPNLCPNGSFEDSTIPGEITSNLLLNPGFDLDNGGTRPGAGWQNLGDPSIDGSYGRSSPNAAVLDNNPSAEAIFQDCAASDGLPCHATCWAATITGESWRFRFVLTYYNAAGTILDTITGSWETPPADNVFRHYQLDWPGPAASGAATLRYRLETNPADSGVHGLNVDDCSLWVEQVGSTSWQPGINSGANFTTLDWAYSDVVVSPYDGGAMVKILPNITGGAGSYAQIMTTALARVQVKQHMTYVVSAWVFVDTAVTVTAAIGAKVWQGTTLQATLVGTTHTFTGGGWHLISYEVVTAASSDGLDVLIRFYTGTQCFVDAVSVWENAIPDISHQEIYYPGDAFTAYRNVSDYTSFLTADAAGSLTKFGPREAEVSNSNVFNLSDLDAFCILYLDAHAASEVNAGLTIFGPTSPVYLDGAVEIVNLPSPPPALAVSNVRYRIDEQGIEMTIDLNNKQPDMALLLREIQEGTR